ncbi:hypothetical protein AtNW77_Chr4g0319221 [Arabidopsis thaliana]|uniref:Uncharacterized protein n=3 Tax=Arabidopsis TaxID=3701 RepID=A0A8T2EGW5_ARASU|nr:hypothetical protein ISN45_At04g041700 [Arabidopsis thaliana x Arabidopsis arenosa]KAG7623445.1 hypothetical protein ISN44_As04g041400 [Arabidopsis suecica]OAO99862.1 hypothetical protein AXX17_AT4G44710 [Arabidopsis thaliana]CAD5330387.1 unnamed protein product [Arabidopsis thaliana]VYS65389.1 unnamed protein product [Arabidopsis thaliana]
MGNCALKPKVLSETGAPAPEELKDSLLEYHKMDAAKSLSNLFLQDKADKITKEDEKITPEKIPVTDDLKTALEEENTPTKEAKSPATETKYSVTEKRAPADEKITPEMMPVTEDLKTVLEEEAKPPATETKAMVDDQKVKNEVAVREEKIIDLVTVKETETEAKTE